MNGLENENKIIFTPGIVLQIVVVVVVVFIGC